ncbi:MAG: hypothetical protein U0903_13365 [Planctomycetales bacterium]
MTATSTYRTALLCGAVPLSTGTVIFLVWLVTGWWWLMPAGIFTIYIGTLLVCFGVAALYRYWKLAIAPRVPKRKRNLRTWLCLGVLLVNFPAAAGMTYAAIDLMTSYRVVVRNDSAKPLVNVELFGPGCTARIGTIPPGRKTSSKLRFQGDGPVVMSATNDGRTHHTTLHGYVSSNFGGSCHVTVQRDGVLTVAPPVP